jgi:hypothetical protein
LEPSPETMAAIQFGFGKGGCEPPQRAALI